MLRQMAMNIAHAGDYINGMRKYSHMTTELYDVPLPDKTWITDMSRVGVILGTPSENIPAELQLSLEPVLMVNVKLMTLKELALAIEEGGAGRAKIIDHYSAVGKATVSDLNRHSVI